MTDAEILDAVAQTFARHPRPERFTDADHCCECAEHDRTLRAHTPESLAIEDVGHPGWDPVSFATESAYLYLFPGLARLALTGRGDEHYLDQFAFQLSHRVHLFEDEEREIVLTLVWRLIERFQDDPACNDFTVWRLDDCLRKLESR